jgi:predicted ATPase
VAELIEQVANRQPLVLVLEDLHWADEMSLRLLAFVSRRIPAWMALLVTTAREEELADAAMARRTVEDLSRASQGMPLVLSPLSQSDTALLVRALARVGSDDRTVARVEAQTWAMSEGNPFVAVEAMRALDQDGLWSDAREAPGALALPARVRDLVVRRLDRLSTRGQQVVAVAAVIGRRFDFTLLQSAAGRTSAPRRRRSRRWSATTCSRPWETNWTSPTIGSARSRMAGYSRPAGGSSIAP